ncbi:LacI family DNA-binding transcriptional regulator [Deinococcus roseus]|uniref:LacI family transcriptional regulator n=1 Tax=Deinococcus roseus TaxID=392414 RepID=A0ABQ2DJL2_9DEIO|nr:LacI family DNA-binding transcriptional regulator [Deinococcus roseus]GGJ57534.1 LacI family transcriptional regulator [Deinococcus roseus]
MPTISDVAKLAGVSPTTAKRALSEPHKLLPQTLEKVQWAIKELDYEPDLTASALGRGKSNAVGLLVANIREPFFAELADQVGTLLRAEGYSLLLADSKFNGELELQNLKLLAGHRVSALIVRPAYGRNNRDYLLKMQDKGTYIIEVDHHALTSPFDFVMLDHQQSVMLGLQHLWNLGHTRIAALGSYDPIHHPEWRSFTFETAMTQMGLSVPEGYRQIVPLTEEGGYQRTRELLSLAERPTAVFALNGTEGMGAFRAIREAGLRIPEDISLLTFDNYPWTGLVSPGIDAIEQPVTEMSTVLVRRILEGENRSVELFGQQFPGRLVVRGSCARPR